MCFSSTLEDLGVLSCSFRDKHLISPASYDCSGKVALLSEERVLLVQFCSVGVFLYHGWYVGPAEVKVDWLPMSVHVCSASSASNTILH